MVAAGVDAELDRYPPSREPAGQLRFDWELAADLGLEHELALVVPLLGAPGGDERVEEPPLVVVNPVQRAALLVPEAEHRAQHALAVTAGLQGGTDRVDPDYELIEVLAAEDQPAIPIA